MWGFNGENRYAHGGMLQAALHIRSELERMAILKKLYCHNTVATSISTPLTEVN